MNDKKP